MQSVAKMAGTLEDTENRLRRASDVLVSLLDDLPSTVLRRADDTGCLSELETLCQDMKVWLADDEYYSDLAYELCESALAGKLGL